MQELKAMALGLAHSLSRYKLKFSPDKVDLWRLNLLPRSLFVMEGPSRYEFHHRIRQVKETRYSITLRTLSQ